MIEEAIAAYIETELSLSSSDIGVVATVDSPDEFILVQSVGGTHEAKPVPIDEVSIEIRARGVDYGSGKSLIGRVWDLFRNEKFNSRTLHSPIVGTNSDVLGRSVHVFSCGSKFLEYVGRTSRGDVFIFTIELKFSEVSNNG